MKNMVTESNTRPLSLKVRKVQIRNGAPTLFLYIHTNIEKEMRYDPDTDETHEVYVYHMAQLSVPVPPTLSDKLNLTKIEDPTWHQRSTRHMFEEKLGDLVFRQNLANRLSKDHVRKIDWRDKRHAISDEELTQIKTFVELKGLMK